MASAEMMHRALELEEIRITIARFLDVPSILACACCCREWHQSFARHIWYSLSLRSNTSQLPPRKLLEANKHYIHQLAIGGWNILQNFELTGCSSLTQLELFGPAYRQEIMDNWHPWTSLVTHHQSTLQHITVCTWIIMAEQFCVALAGCSKLKTLRLSGRLIDQDNGVALWNACQTLQSLHLEYTGLPDWKPETPPNASQIQRLTVTKPQRSCNGLELLKQCPQLRSLTWSDSDAVMLPLQAMGQALLKNQQWPHLEELNLNLIGYKEQDQDLAMMLEGIHRLVTLHAASSGFGPKCVEAIRMHQSTVTTLDLAMCLQITSPMVQTLLTSMTALESLTVGRIHYLDIIDGGPWVSLQLRRLAIAIDMKKPPEVEEEERKKRKQGVRHSEIKSVFEAQQRGVFQRLSTLERLCSLALLSPSSDGSMGNDQTLDFRQRMGLDSLSTLKQLEEFAFKSFHQYMTMNDVRWILDHWPRIRKITGQLSMDPADYYEMKSFLNSRGISVCD